MQSNALYMFYVLKRVWLLLLFTLPVLSLSAAVEPYQHQLRGALKKGDVLTVKDEKFQNTQYDWNKIQNLAVDNMITFGLFRDSAYRQEKPFTCELTLKVEYWSQPGQTKPVAIEDVKLKIAYDTTAGAVYKGQDLYRFKNAHRFRVTIKEINSPEWGDKLPPVFVLNAQIFVDRNYLPDENAVPASAYVSRTANADAQAIQKGGNTVQGRSMSPMSITATEDLAVDVEWGVVGGAVEYDLEWTFIDDASANGIVLANAGQSVTPAQLAPMMRNNATRVTLSYHNYKISLVHSSKYLLLRWRGVSYEDNGTFRREQPWNYQVTYEGVERNGVIELATEWHFPDLNWQYNATYAEEGKRKEIVSYFDGTLRNRQTVTVSSPDHESHTQDRAIVQQNVYDEFGRVAANVLPAPVEGTELKYYGNVNFVGTNAPYTHADAYNGTIASHTKAPLPMAALGGAAKYYSAQNPFLSDHNMNKYIPDAKGYPFSVIHYTPDNTGRVTIQGGVGDVMQPGEEEKEDRVTRFYYARPYEGELERLFGSDVGNASHYLKKIAVDPNKQISFSYENASGKTVATALAGPSPGNLERLPSALTAPEMTVLRLKPDNMVFDRSSLTVRGYTTYVNTERDVIAKLQYEVEQIIKTYEENDVKICSNCYYALRLKIQDEFGDPLATFSQPVTVGSATSDCSIDGVRSDELEFEFKKVGAYYITFELAMSPDVIADYTEDFIRRNTNLRKEFSFVLDALKETDFSGCFTECTSCMKELGTREYFVGRMQEQMQRYDVDISGSLNSQFESWANGLYTTLLSNCQAAQASCIASPCEELKTVMMQDVSPGGQYALFSLDMVPLEPSVNVLALYWRQKFEVIADQLDTRYAETAIWLPDGTYTSPHDPAFTLSMLVTYWRPEWAERFLDKHPEYCALQACNNVATYRMWDKKLQTVYTTAADISKIAAGLTYESDNPFWLLAADPFFQKNAPGFAFLSAFRSDLTDYSTRVLTGVPASYELKNILRYVDYSLYCIDGNMTPPTEHRWNFCTPAAGCRIPDREWQLFLELYLQQKEKYYQSLADGACAGACVIGAPDPVFPVLTSSPVIVNNPTVDFCATVSRNNVAIFNQPQGPGYNVTVSYNDEIPAGYRVTVFFRNATQPGGLAATHVFTNENYNISVLGYMPYALAVDSVRCSYIGGGDFCSTVNTSNFQLHLVAPVPEGSTTREYYIDYTNAATTAIPAGTSVILYTGAQAGSRDHAIVFNHDNYTGNYYFNADTDQVITGIACFIDGACPAFYQSKVSRRVKTSAMATDSTTVGLVLRAKMSEVYAGSCAAQADVWMQQLEPCIAGLSDTTGKRAALREALIQVCMAGASPKYPDGVSILEAGVISSLGDASFEAAIKRVLGISALSMECNPWLLESPYPFGVRPQVTDQVIGATTKEFCEQLAAIKLEHMNTAPGLTLYQYLMQKYGKQVLKLTAAELAMLEKGCTNCRYLLERSVPLPVFMDTTSVGCVNAAAFAQAWAQVQSIATAPNHPNYSQIVAIYLNHRWGFTLSYSDYAAYAEKVQANAALTDMLCNEPAFPAVTIDPYGCVIDQVATAINGGKRQYLAYIDAVKEEFRRSYVEFCGKNRAKVNLLAREQVHHYTLYYYDQAGNLIRTVPPEGVQLLDAAAAERAVTAREQPNTECLYNGPAANTDKSIAFNKLATAIGASNGSVEMWLKGDFSGARQMIATPDGKYLLNLCIDGRFLNVDIYKLKRLAGGGATIGLSNHARADMASVYPLGEWVHIVVQGDNLATKAMKVYVNGASCPNIKTGPKPACSWQVNMNGQLEELPEDISALKHLRVYNRQLTADEISANATEICMGIAPGLYASLVTEPDAPMQVWGRFNTPVTGPGSPAEPGTVEQQAPQVFPGHRMTTSYAYTSLNQVVQQQTPDAGISKFWYDKLGRLYASQNAEQLAPLGPGAANRFSYTKYDWLGRVLEVGEKSNVTHAPLSIPGFSSRPLVADFLPSANGDEAQITTTLYDVAYTGFSGTQDNLRKRVSATTFKETEGSAVSQASYYSYDQLGNVKTLWQRLGGLTGYRQIDYKYDLASGKVNMVRYAPLLDNASTQRFYYAYEYDGENRVTAALAGVNGTGADNWTVANSETEASYQYYLHGPLSRAEIGHYKVQGLDYAYTLQGWIKGVNGNFLGTDMGGDNVGGSTVGADVMAYSLDYFSGDYKAIGTNNELKLQWDNTAARGKDLYNGNISRSTVALKNINTNLTAGYSYTYDQLNRLKSMRQHGVANTATSWGSTVPGNAYGEDVQYDANGNILTYKRYGAGNTLMDDLDYQYELQDGFLKNNRLNHVDDAAGAVYTSGSDPVRDIAGNQSYQYDKIGNLISENGVPSISWTVYGKIKSIDLGSDRSLEYKYDASGNRISKTLLVSNVPNTTTWYVRDAQGNVLAVYEKSGSGAVQLIEQHLYGSSRLGVWEVNKDATTGNIVDAWNETNNRKYELSNHLGNVLATLSDDGCLMTANDYYPFGMMQWGRNYRLGGGYRYGFNGKENDDEVKGDGNQQDYGMRVYDPRLGRFLSVDPLTSLYAFYSPYHFAGNTPVNAIDLDGMEPTGNVMDVNRQSQRTVFEHGERFLLDNRNWIFAQPYIINEGIMKGAQSYHFYWWKNNEWQAFRPGQNMYDLADGMGKVALGATTTVAGGMLARALIGSGTWIYSAAIQYYRFAPTIAAAGRFGAELLDESGTIGVQNAGYNHLVNYGASQIRKFITTEEGALFQVEKFKKVITEGGEGLKRLLADPIYAVEYAGQTYILDGHNRLKAFSDLEQSVNVTLLSIEEATKSFKDKMDDIIKGEFKTEIKDDF